MTNAQEYFKQKKESSEFKKAIKALKTKVDLEWELEAIKEQILKDEPKEKIIKNMDILKEHLQTYQSKKIRV